MRRHLILIGLGVALAVPIALVAQKEALRASDTRLLLELEPVDPRSLMQGDYMVLRYELVRKLGDTSEWPSDGRLVLAVDEQRVGRFVRRDDGSPLEPGELFLSYRKRDRGKVRLGAEAFFFQEGQAHLFEEARYGELRVSVNGDSLLVGLADEAMRPLGPAALRSGLDHP